MTDHRGIQNMFTQESILGVMVSLIILLNGLAGFLHELPGIRIAALCFAIGLYFAKNKCTRHSTLKSNSVLFLFLWLFMGLLIFWPPGQSAAGQLFSRLGLIVCVAATIQAIVVLATKVAPLQSLLMVGSTGIMLSIALAIYSASSVFGEISGFAKYLQLNNTPEIPKSDSIQWTAETYRSDPELEFTRIPNSRFIGYYPSDPKDYFTKSNKPDWLGMLDLRTFTMRQQSLCGNSEIELPSNASGVIKFHHRCESNGFKDWHDELLRNGIEFYANLPVFVTFTARGTPQQAGRFVAILRPGKSATTLFDETFILQEQWTTYRFAMTPEETARGEFSIRFSNPHCDFELTDFYVGVGPIQNPTCLLWQPRHSVEFQMNSLGFRDVEHRKVKEPNTIKIAFLGDSMTEGWGVHFDDIVTRQLQRRLDSSAGSQIFEVMNFAVSGYASHQQRRLYEKIVRQYKPDIVIVMICFNDDMSALEESNIRVLLDKDPSKVSPEQRRRVALERQTDFDYTRCVRELRQINTFCELDGAQLVLCLFRQNRSYPWDECGNVIFEGMKETKALLLDPVDLIADHDDLIVHRIDRHPNHLAHAMMAEFLFQKLKAAGQLKSQN